jgi:hypothetical protein
MRPNQWLSMCKEEEEGIVKQYASINSPPVCNPRIASQVVVFEDQHKPYGTRCVGNAVPVVSEQSIC